MQAQVLITIQGLILRFVLHLKKGTYMSLTQDKSKSIRWRQLDLLDVDPEDPEEVPAVFVGATEALAPGPTNTALPMVSY